MGDDSGALFWVSRQRGVFPHPPIETMWSNSKVVVFYVLESRQNSEFISLTVALGDHDEDADEKYKTTIQGERGVRIAVKGS